MAFNKIKKILAYGMLGLGLAYNISCGKNLDNCSPPQECAPITFQCSDNLDNDGDGLTDLDDIGCSNPQDNNEYNSVNNSPEIITTAIPNAKAGEYYTAQIDFFDADNDQLTATLINPPQGMTLEYNILKWSPRHSQIGPNLSQTGNYNIELEVTDGIATASKTLELIVLTNATNLDYLRIDENIRFVCELSCPFNSDYLDKKSNGVFNSIKILKNTVQSDAPQIYKPVDFHLERDSECRLSYPSYTSFTSDNRRLICNYIQYDANGDGKLNGLSSSPEAIEDNAVPMHEYIHDILDNKPVDYTYEFQESFAGDISIVLSDGSGYLPGLDSLCGFTPDPSYPYKLAYNLCKPEYGFDMKDLPDLFTGLEIMTNPTIQDIKYLIDSIKKTDTRQAFIDSNILVE